MYLLSEKKSMEHRLSRIYGHLGAIRRMSDEKRDCEDILIQLLAVRAAVNNLGKMVLSDYMENYLPEDIIGGNEEEIKKLENALKMFILS